jgi:hypothetical protein
MGGAANNTERGSLTLRALRFPCHPTVVPYPRRILDGEMQQRMSPLEKPDRRTLRYYLVVLHSGVAGRRIYSQSEGQKFDAPPPHPNPSPNPAITTAAVCSPHATLVRRPPFIL